MAYADYEEVRKILREQFAAFPDDLTDQVEIAEAWVNSKLAGFYSTPFDDVSLYTEVPVQIKWITAYWLAWKLYDELTVLETTPHINTTTSAADWKQMAEDWCQEIREGEMRLTYEDGSLVPITNGTGAPRFAPSGAAVVNTDNEPFFSRDQAHEW